jgi:two-component system, OmpR family, phosphate regulon sensor histidine kinase PhoR
LSLSQTSVSRTPRRRERPLWPIVLAGGTGLVAILVLDMMGRADSIGSIIALFATAGATAFAMIMADRGAEADVAPSLERPREPDGAALDHAALIDVLPDPVLVISATDPDDLAGRRYLYANTAARGLLRIDRREGPLITVLRDPEVLEAVDEALFGGIAADRLFETGGVQSRTLRAHARPLPRAEDGPHMVLLWLSDETELRTVERTRADFLANASHELRTPLASLTGFIETLRGHAREDPGARDRFLGIMQAQAERMSRLIDDLMSLSRIELNEHIAPSEAVDFAAAASEVVEALAPLAEERGVRLDADLPRGSARVLGDRDQMVQVVQNLVDNALKYSPRGGVARVTVEAGLTVEAATALVRPGGARLSLLTPDRPADAYAVLRVADEGPGIARADLPRLTERFYRVEGQKSGERSGTGLGLAIVKHIVNRHRGGLSVESRPEGGTIFTVYLPIAETAGTPGVAKLS